jgi:hypothetical protein
MLSADGVSVAPNPSDPQTTVQGVVVFVPQIKEKALLVELLHG